MHQRRRIFLTGSIIVAVLVAATTSGLGRNTVQFLWGKVRGGYSVTERLDQFGAGVELRLRPAFEAAGVLYPPTKLAFLAFKDSKVLEMYATSDDLHWRFIKMYPVLAASGNLGPKLREGDRQVPEGVYALDSLNPNSRFHLSVRLDYPNGFDQRMAKLDGRSKLGGDIMIHGSSVSVGCLAIGDEAAEEVFVLSALLERNGIKVIISPTDFRDETNTKLNESPPWVGTLYETLRAEIRPFQKKRSPSLTGGLDMTDLGELGAIG